MHATNNESRTVSRSVKSSFPTPFSDAFRRPPAEFLDVGHSRLAYYRFGSGPDVFFIHGWPLNAATFRNLLPWLAAHYTCHLIDLPGAGRTEIGPETPLDLQGHVETARRAIERLGLSRFALVAHDSGGFVARVLAAEDPRLTGVVLGNTEIPGHVPGLIVAYSLLARVPGFAGIMRRVLEVGALRRSALGFGSCFESSASIDGEFAELIVGPLLTSPRAMGTQLSLLTQLDGRALSEALLAAHERILAPTQLVWGTADTFFPVDGARAMVSQFRAGATLVEIPDGKLFAHEERAEEFAAHALPFLERCFRAPAAS